MLSKFLNSRNARVSIVPSTLLCKTGKSRGNLGDDGMPLELRLSCYLGTESGIMP